MRTHIIKLACIAFTFTLLAACTGKEPLDEINYKSNERAIEEFRVPGQVGKVQITRTADSCGVTVKVLADQLDLTQVKPEILVSLGATVKPASGEPVDFAAAGNQVTYQVTSETGVTRDWTVKIETFTLPGWLNKLWRIEPRSASTGGANATNYLVTGPNDAATAYPGTNPLGVLTDHLVTRGYMAFIKTAGSGVFKYTRPLSFFKFVGSIPTIMKEYDNTLRFNYTGFNEDATAIRGTFSYGAGTDGQYAVFPIVTATTTAATPVTTVVDLNKVFRQIPMGDGTFEFDLSKEVLSLYDADGKLFSATSTRGTIIDNSGKTVTVSKAFNYNETNQRLQLRYYLPTATKLPGESTGYDLKKIQTNLTPYPYLHLSTSSITSDTYYQLSGTEEVWYDFIPAE